MKQDNLNIHDKWIFFFVYPVIAVLSVHIGNDNDFGVLLRLPSYYTDLLLAFTLTYGFGLYFRKLFHWIDRKFDWHKMMRQRLLYHFGLGIVAPALIAMGIEILYLNLINIPLKESSVFYLELPVIFLFCVLINLIYLLMFGHIHTKKTAAILQKTTTEDPQNQFTENFVVQAGSRAFTVSQNDVAYFALFEKHTFLVTTNGKQYLYNSSLEKISGMVSPITFFQLNRQVLANRNSIKGFHQTVTRRLLVELNPPFGKPVYVAKTKAAKFTGWLSQSLLSVSD
jgi:hypothetical protein